MPDRTATLVLSGGGARGAFQVGAERVFREERGYDWDGVFGISVGALNATLIAQRRQDALLDVWRTVRQEDVYREYSWLRVAWRLAILRRLGAYDNRPLRDLIRRHAAGHPFVIPARVGRVSLVTGAYELVSSTDTQEAAFLDAVWASATMPVIWEPVGDAAYVDGGLRNVTPLGDALATRPAEVVVIMCTTEALAPEPRLRSIVDVTERALVDITIHEIMLDDIREFVRINRLVRQAEAAGVTLKDDDGVPYRAIPITLIRPSAPLTDTLDFSREAIRASLEAGETAARAVPGPDDGTGGPGRIEIRRRGG